MVAATDVTALYVVTDVAALYVATDVAALYVVAHGPAATSAEDVTSNSRASREGTVAMG